MLNLNKHRLSRDMQQYQELEQSGGAAAALQEHDDILEEMKERYDKVTRDKKDIENKIQSTKDKLQKAKQLGNNAPLAKYYREQTN